MGRLEFGAFPLDIGDNLCHVSLVNVQYISILKHQLLNAYRFCTAAVSKKIVSYLPEKHINDYISTCCGFTNVIIIISSNIAASLQY